MMVLKNGEEAENEPKWVQQAKDTHSEDQSIALLTLEESGAVERCFPLQVYYHKRYTSVIVARVLP